MKLLVDSHAFIWFYEERNKLSSRVLEAISELSNELFLSIGSIWEIQLKIQSGKLAFKDPLKEIINEQQVVNGMQILPIALSHILELEKLPLHHKDPFDRLLISQAIIESMILVSSDKHFAQYEVGLLW